MLSAIWTAADRWKGRIFYALIDQGVTSAANFLLSILYVSWLPLDGFGRYVVVWTVSMLVETIQTALIMDSLPAIVSRYGQRNRRRLDTASTWVVLVYGLAISLLILAAIPIAAAWTSGFVLPLLCLAAVNPLQRLYLLSRRLCYIRDRQDVVALASSAYAITLLAGAFTLYSLGILTVPVAVLLWGLGNGVALLVTYVAGIAGLRRIAPAAVAWLTLKLWRSGRWLAGGAVGYWVANWGVFPIVASVGGVDAAGVLRALQNLFSPVIQFNAALNLAILPRVADKVASLGQPFARTFAIYGSIVFTGVVALYAAIVMSQAKNILPLIYDKPEIASAAYLLWPLAIVATLESARQASAMALLALGRSRVFFTTRIIAVVTFLGGAAVLGRMFGFEGVLWANVLAHAIATVLFVPHALGIPNALKKPYAALGSREPDKDRTLSPRSI